MSNNNKIKGTRIVVIMVVLISFYLFRYLFKNWEAIKSFILN